MRSNILRLLACSAGATAMMSAVPVMAQDVEDEIIAVGIRASLERGVNIKENADTIVDAISAEDLGKFPDINVAESLQRITGVAITRTRGGEGQFVTVRGLGEEFNAVTYNGRLLATENNGREFSFDSIASELISGAEVYKSSSASQGDGSLGGRVNIRSAKPLDSSGFRASASIAGQYESLSENIGPRISGVVSNTFNDDKVGIIASFSYQQRDVRSDIAESTFLIPDVQVDSNGLVNGALDADGDGLNDLTGAQIVVGDGAFNGFAPSVSFQDRERIGGTLALQFQPTDSTDITIDGLYTNFDSPGNLFGYSYFPSAFGGSFTGSNAEVNELNQVTRHDIQAFSLDLVSRFTQGEAETFALGGNIEHKAGDRLTLEGDISYSRAEGNRDNFGSAGGSGTFFVLGFPNNAQVSFDATQSLTPDLTFTTDTLINGTVQTVGLDGLTAEDVRLHFARRDTVDVEDEIFSLKGDADYEFSDDFGISVGADYVSREKSNLAFNNIANQCRFCGYATSVASVASGEVAGLFSTFDDDFLSGADGNFPRVFPTFSVEALERIYAASGNADALIAEFDPSASSVVGEDVLGGYVQLDYKGEFGELPFQLNIGVRGAFTDLTSSGVAQTINSITSSELLRDPNGVTTSNQNLPIAAAAAIDIENDYFDILPAANFSLDVTEDIKLRLAASRSLSRPTLTDLSTFFAITSTNPGGEQIQSANPQLEAITSNNFDASVEWYGDGGGTFVSVAGFYKDLSDFVTNTVVSQSVTLPQTIVEQDGSITDNGTATIPFLVFAPQNGDEAEVYGLEVAAQKTFDFGFGASGNVTFAESSATTGGVTSQLENISDISANASVFYENNGFQARASLNHRSDYLIGQTVEGGQDEFADDFTQIDVSLAYDVNETFTVFGEGINVFNEEIVRTVGSPNSNFLEAFEDNGARWVMGVRGTF